MKKPLHLTIRNHRFLMHPEKTLFWEDQNILLIADAHFGKASHFRKAGMAVPTATIGAGLDRLEGIFHSLNPKTCVFLGDLFHSSHNHEWERFSEVIGRHPAIQFILIKGNHDILPMRYFDNIALEVLEELKIDGVLLTHHPDESEGLFNICGHVHPGVKLRGRAFLTEKLPCFYLRNNQLILPSFGNFTGKKIITPKTGDRIFVVTPKEVMELGGILL
jgi:uncharacterized protein